jgi:hypothetical protein
MITGKVAGLQVINGGGSPGEGATIRIKKRSSLSATMTLYMLLIMFQLRPEYQRRKKSIDNNQPKQYRIYYCFERCF